MAARKTNGISPLSKMPRRPVCRAALPPAARNDAD